MIVAAGVFGSLIGSFLNVVVYRVPAGLSVVSPPSACPRCDQRIRGWDNIPLVSWLVLRGRCRGCSGPISARYPLVELGTALGFAAVAAWWLLAAPFGATEPVTTASAAHLVGALLGLVAFLYLSAISIALALIDLDVQRLPDRIVLPAYAVLAVLLTASALLAGQPGRLVPAAVGGAALFALYFLLGVIRPGGMGAGDVKLAGVLGIALGWLGWPQLIVGAFAAFLVGGVIGITLVAARRVRRGGGIPFGPWMLAGAWIGIVAGGPIAAGYLNIVGLG